MKRHSNTARRLRIEALEDRRLLAAATFAEVSAAVGLGGLRGGSGEFHGGGLSFNDLNNDGYADLYLIGPSSRGNRLYINVDDGNGGRTYLRAAADGGAAYGAGNSIGAISADYDNDGDVDLYLANYNASNILFKNMWMEDHPTGAGDPMSLRFVDVTPSTDPTPTDPAGDDQQGLAFAVFENPNPLFNTTILNNTMSAAWADVNRDGWVDLYVGSWDGTNGNPAESLDGKLGERDTLYLNNGDGTFTDITMGPNGYVVPASLVDDGSFESAVHTTTVSNSNWQMSAPNSSAEFRAAAWAASDGAQGVWFKGFRGNPTNPVDASVTQQIVAPTSGDYTLRFDARVEDNFPSVVGAFQASIASSGTGGNDTIDLLAASPDDTFHTHTLSLSGVTAGDTITITAEMLDTTGTGGQQVSGFVDTFFLEGPDTANGWEQVGGWAYSDGTFNDPDLPAEFSGQNGLQFADFNNDGWQDLIVATMGGGGVAPNRDMLYINRGVDTEGEWLGYELVSYDIGFGGSESSDMGVAVADIDNDGDLDYFTTILPDNHPLWINNLTDTGTLGFTQTTVTNTFSWGANFHDFDNNGRVDLLVGTEVDRRSFLHMQEWNGIFNEQAVAAGLTSTYSTRGVATADFDRDGWSEAALWAWNGNNPGIQFYQNNSAPQNGDFHFLTLELEGDPTLPGQFKSTRDAIGARAYVTADFNGNGTIDADETRLEEVLSGHSNGATTSSLALEFGLGMATSADVLIEWQSGRMTQLYGVAADQFLAVTEQAANVDVLVGDYNGDGIVNTADYTMHRDTLGDQVTPFSGADGNGNGTIDPADYDSWRANFGGTRPPVSATAAIETFSLQEANINPPPPSTGEGLGEGATLASSPTGAFIVTPAISPQIATPGRSSSIAASDVLSDDLLLLLAQTRPGSDGDDVESRSQSMSDDAARDAAFTSLDEFLDQISDWWTTGVGTSPKR